MKKEKVYPYGFKTWMNQLASVGNSLKMWNIFPPDCHKHLDFDAWLEYFMIGLSPSKAILADIKEGGE